MISCNKKSLLVSVSAMNRFLFHVVERHQILRRRRRHDVENVLHYLLRSFSSAPNCSNSGCSEMRGPIDPSLMTAVSS